MADCWRRLLLLLMLVVTMKMVCEVKKLWLDCMKEKEKEQGKKFKQASAWVTLELNLLVLQSKEDE